MSEALPTPDTAAIDALVQEAMRAWTVPGAAVAIVRGDEVVYLQGSGIKEVGSNQVVTSRDPRVLDETYLLQLINGRWYVVDAQIT